MRKITSSLAGLALLVAVLAGAASAQNPIPVTPQPYPPASPVPNFYFGPTVEGVFPYVAGLTPYSAETNNMSLEGYLRALVFQRTGKWMSLADAERVLRMQRSQ